MPKEKTNFWESAYMNNRTYIQYYNRLMELAMSMFRWKNLPSTVDERYLELCLFAKGFSVFFKDEDLSENQGEGGYLAMECMIGGDLNVYRIPNHRRAYAPNGYNKELTQNDSVLIFNNYLHTNSMLDIEMFAKRLYNLDRIVDVNANAQKTPVLILCDETQRLTMKNLYKQYEGNEPFIFGNKALDVKGLTVLKTDAPYVADKIYNLKTQIWNEALTYLGIANINTQKKERMITDEVVRNQGGVIASRKSRLNARKQACEQINKMFGLEVDVEYDDSIEDYAIDYTEESEEVINE